MTVGGRKSIVRKRQKANTSGDTLKYRDSLPMWLRFIVSPTKASSQNAKKSSRNRTKPAQTGFFRNPVWMPVFS
jgi:hypothetical protein